jgi:hypothetical protein
MCFTAQGGGVEGRAAFIETLGYMAKTFGMEARYLRPGASLLMLVKP